MPQAQVLLGFMPESFRGVSKLGGFQRCQRSGEVRNWRFNQSLNLVEPIFLGLI